MPMQLTGSARHAELGVVRRHSLISKEPILMIQQTLSILLLTTVLFAVDYCFCTAILPHYACNKEAFPEAKYCADETRSAR